MGTLTVIATLLIFSAGLRLIGASTEAFALDGQNGPLANATTGDAVVAQNAEMDLLLTSFQLREQKIKVEEARISARVKTLEQAERTIAEKITQLEDAEARLRELLAIASSASEDDVARLTAVYENMKPKDAAVVFEEMEPAFAAGFLARMRSDAAASIMAGLAPKTAYAISVVLAGRHSEIKRK
jgi:flagellar motility protein MotE (MotC chaperone)